jgi:hypothetical protein
MHPRWLRCSFLKYCPIFSVVTPCHRGASPPSVRRRDFHHGLLATTAYPDSAHRAAVIRILCDWLVVSQILPTNPAAAVRGPSDVITTLDPGVTLQTKLLPK